MRLELRKRIFLNFVLLVALFGILASLMGAIIINRTTLNEAQRSVSLNLRSAWSVLRSKQDELRVLVSVLGTGKRVASAFLTSEEYPSYSASLEAARRQCGFDFLSLTDDRGRVIVRTLEPYRTGDDLSNDPFVSAALKGQALSGLAILGANRLSMEGGDLEERAFMAFEPTPKAKPRAKTSESSGMALIAAAPARDEKGNIVGALYAGILLNRNHSLVDRIRSIVFEERLYEGRQLGTVTIFQWDVRVATNVVLPNGNRAIGTRVSTEVYDKVLENNENWYDRAFVVNDWYISAYDPIHDVEGKVIGILYVGLLAKKYDDMKRALWKLYAGLSLAAALVLLAVGFIFARRLTGSVARLAEAAGRIAQGNLDLRVPDPPTDDEVRDLTRAFNAMASSLRDREERLKAVNAELERANSSLQLLNSNYLDMLGFVSHELKNTLGVIYTSARTLDIGLVGSLSEPQAALVRGISRSIEAAVAMTRNYLDLARIEKGELQVHPKAMDLTQEVVNPVMEELASAISERGITVENQIPVNLTVEGDPALLRVVYKNLLGNALKYGRPQGKIRLGFQREQRDYLFEVWNDGKGLSPENLSRLFGKFVRFHDDQETERKGTGLGLFITKEIIEKHGGRIWAESCEGQWIAFRFTLPAHSESGNH